MLCAIALIASAVGLILNRSNSYSSIIPSGIRQQAGFTLYYPKDLPNDYTGVEGSAKLAGGTVFYEVRKGNGTVTISQQAVPANPPDLNTFEGFRKIAIRSGEAISGQYNGSAVVIMLTNSALVTIQANSPDLSGKIVTTIAEHMDRL